MSKETLVIIIDGDGTCWTHSFPHMGKDIGAVPVLKKIVANGHKLVLFTMRSDNVKNPTGGETGAKGGLYLTHAVNWFKENGITLYGIQTNPTQRNWTTNPKAHGDYIIDDIAAFAPLIYNPEFHNKPYIDWVKMEEELIRIGIIK